MTVPESTKCVHLLLWILTGLIWSFYIVVRIIYGGDCDRPALTADFERQRYLGTWHEMYRDTSIEFSTPGEDECVVARYLELSNNYFEVKNLSYSIERAENIGGVPNPGKGQCSNLQSGFCQIKFNDFLPWSGYSVV